jgi:hypothetical protein
VDKYWYCCSLLWEICDNLQESGLYEINAFQKGLMIPMKYMDLEPPVTVSTMTILVVALNFSCVIGTPLIKGQNFSVHRFLEKFYCTFVFFSARITRLQMASLVGKFLILLVRSVNWHTGLHGKKKNNMI